LSRISSNCPNLIKDDHLKNQLFGLYDLVYQRNAELISNSQGDLLNGKYGAFIERHFIKEATNKELSRFRWVPLDYESMIGDPHYKSILMQKKSMNDNNISSTDAYAHQAVDVMKLIEDYIDR